MLCSLDCLPLLRRELLKMFSNCFPLQKRSGYFHSQATNVCPRNRTWERLYTATDSHGNDVIVSPKYYLAGIEFQQRFYTVNCDYETLAIESACDKCCLAIDHTRYDKTYMSEILNFITSMCIFNIPMWVVHVTCDVEQMLLAPTEYVKLG